DGGPEDDADPQRLIELGGQALRRIVESGAFVDVDREVFFLYRLRLEGHTQVGIVGLVEVDDYLGGHVKRHEQVDASRADHLSRHYEQLGAQSSPIALGYRHDEVVRLTLDAVLDHQEPVVEFTSGDGLEQAVWIVEDPTQIETLVERFSRHDLYIMDGHHRAAAAGALRSRIGSTSSERMLSVLFSDDRINIGPFHRHVTVPVHRDLGEVFAEVQAELGLIPDPSMATRLPDAAGGVGVWMNGQWWKGNLPVPEADNPLSAIDPVRLQNRVVGPILGIDPAFPAGRLAYFLDDADRAAIAAACDEHQILFVLRHVTPEEVFDVADAGLDMPPKSTYVTPKPRSGVFLRQL
ncbi:MAG: DUF1015 family protein, partial [Acidimicrobiales bacterium]